MQLKHAGLLITIALHALVVGGLALSESGCGEKEASAAPDPKNMEVIEAALAYRKKEAPRQPQKKRRKQRKKLKPVGVSRDENKQVAPSKPKDKDPDYSKEWEKFRDQNDDEEDDEEETGNEDVRPGGAFDGHERGWADENKGDPYLRELAKQIDFDVPTLERGKGAAIACVRLQADGKVIDTKMWQKSGNTNIDRAAEDALRKITELRQEESESVPDHLMAITTKWTCFKLGL